MGRQNSTRRSHGAIALGSPHRTGSASDFAWRSLPRLTRPDFGLLLGRSRSAFLPSFHGEWDGLAPEAMAATARSLSATATARNSPVVSFPARIISDQRRQPRVANQARCSPISRVRRSIAAAARQRIREFSTSTRWPSTISMLDSEWDKHSATGVESSIVRGKHAVLGNPTLAVFEYSGDCSRIARRTCRRKRTARRTDSPGMGIR